MTLPPPNELAPWIVAGFVLGWVLAATRPDDGWADALSRIALDHERRIRQLERP